MNDPQAGSETAEQSPEQIQQEEERKKASWAERRFARITQARYRAEAEAKFWRERAEASQQQPAAPGVDPSQQPVTPPQPGTRAPQPQDVVSLARQLADQQLSAQAFNAASSKAVTEGKKAFPDFEVAVKNLGGMGALFEDDGAPTGLAREVMATDIPHRILHALGNDPDRVEELLLMTPTQQARAIGRMEAQLLAQPPAAPNVSNAPPPIRPAGSRGQSTTTAPADSDSTGDWIRKRNAQLYRK